MSLFFPSGNIEPSNSKINISMSLFFLSRNIEPGNSCRICTYRHLARGKVSGTPVSSNYKLKLDPVGSTVRYEMMKLCTGSVKDTMRR